MNFKNLLLLLRKVRFFFGGGGGGVGPQRGGSSPLISRIDLVSKNLLTSSFRDFSTKRFEENCYQKSIEQMANFAKLAKVTRIFLAM